MTYSIREIIINGARQKVLVQEHIPIYYPNLYITHELRKRSPNTQQAFLNHLIVLFEFFKAEGIDIESRLNNRPTSNYLSDVELSRFVQHANWKKSVLDKKYAGVSLLPEAYEEIGSTQAEARCEAARDYLVFIYEQLGDRKGIEKAVDWLKARVKRKIIASKPSWRRSSIEDVKGLTDEQREILYEKLNPVHSENPFKRDAQRYRNFIIILFGIELGLRRSEMLLVKLSDIDYTKRTIDVVRPTEVIDKRKSAPRLKTNERRLPCSDLLISTIEAYRLKHRISVSSRKHPFLLVAHGRNEGEALKIKSVDGIFKTISNRFPLLTGITPHTLRHDSVYTLLANMTPELKKLSVEDRAQRVQKVLTWAFGWNPASEMPSLYGAKFWHEKASEFFAMRSERFAGLPGRISKLLDREVKEET